MNITTLYFGELQVEDQDIITLTQGMPGFEDLTKYTFVKPDEDLPFVYFQSLEVGQISFLMINPFVFFKEYDFELPLAVQKELNIQQPEDVTVWAVVTMTKDMKASANLIAPVIVNHKDNVGKQIILHDTGYQIRHEIAWTSSDETKEVER